MWCLRTERGERFGEVVWEGGGDVSGLESFRGGAGGAGGVCGWVGEVVWGEGGALSGKTG